MSPRRELPKDTDDWTNEDWRYHDEMIVKIQAEIDRKNAWIIIIDEEQAQKLFDQAQEHKAKGEIDQAKILLKLAHKLSPFAF